MNKIGNVFAGLIAVWVLAAMPAVASTLTVKNFDYDLCTVTVSQGGNVLVPVSGSGTALVYEVSGEVTLAATDFQNDYYFRFAPAAVTDRTLALERWEGLPDGADAAANPVTFTVSGNLTVIPNVDCKGYVWTATNPPSMALGF